MGVVRLALWLAGGGNVMKTIMLAAAFVGGLAFGAQAETFTFTTNGTLSASVMTPGPNGTMRVAAISNSKGSTMYGTKSVPTDNNCAAWPSQPGDIFAVHGMCTYSDPTGTGYIRFGCNPGKAPTDDNCVGGIWGTGGAYKDRSGTLAWHDHVNPDGKTATSVGAGQWGD